jgi:hypothetical protein
MTADSSTLGTCWPLTAPAPAAAEHDLPGELGVLAVRDEDSGIFPDHATHVFDPFPSADPRDMDNRWWHRSRPGDHRSHPGSPPQPHQTAKGWPLSTARENWIWPTFRDRVGPSRRVVAEFLITSL